MFVFAPISICANPLPPSITPKASITPNASSKPDTRALFFRLLTTAIPRRRLPSLNPHPLQPRTFNLGTFNFTPEICSSGRL